MASHGIFSFIHIYYWYGEAVIAAPILVRSGLLRDIVHMFPNRNIQSTLVVAPLLMMETCGLGTSNFLPLPFELARYMNILTVVRDKMVI